MQLNVLFVVLGLSLSQMAMGVTPATGGLNCNHGDEVNGCCVCHMGWDLDGAGQCTVCAKGFYGGIEEGVCTNTRPGSPCFNGRAAPFGCGAKGVCGSSNGADVFPCAACTDSTLDPVTYCRFPKKCLPNGPHMYTPFPNRPVTGKRFNILVVGCDLQENDKYLIIPQYKSGNTETPNECEINNEADFSASCRFNETRQFIQPTSACPKGVFIDGGMVMNGDNRATITDVVFDRTSMDLAPGEMMVNARAGIDKSAYMVCRKEMSLDGTPVWRRIDSHNEFVDMRDDRFVIDEVQSPSERGAAGMGYDGEDCCDGLEIGFCLPLWAFILLWLLMALCLGALGYALWKNKNELEMNKNNQKYEKFDQAEMNDFAANSSDEEDL
eukprot:TRINITY_DN9209_c0_g1_i1.p1 TRINITY_DN9209_c0_g1~~TRINITY_DN9209_c0_g1_i1.p1  ORF type:complete len:382 (+),score=88.47 TRINITY_DN9209_c0_g1_i1:68-1213(+)